MSGKSAEDGGESGEFMQEFFGQKKMVEVDIRFIAESTRELENLHEQSKLAMKEEEQREISTELERVVNETQKRASAAKKQLNAMKLETERLKRTDTPPAEVRIRESTHMTLVRKMVTEMKAHQKAKQKFSERSRDDMKRLAHVVCPDMPEAEVDRRLQSGGTAFLREAITTSVNEEAQMAWEDVQSRAKDVEMLERSVHQMFQLFKDLATLVDEQGENLDSIEANIDNAGNYVEKGNAELVRAHEYQKKVRKRRCCILIAGIILLVIIIVPLSTIVGA